MSNNVFQNIQLQRIADGIQGGGSSVTVNIDVTGAGDMKPATASAAGAHGLVPAPAAGDEDKVLSGAGTWINAGTVGELGDLEDVDLTSPTSGESLKYDGTKWVNGNVTADLPDFIEETSGSMVTVEAAERPAKSLVVAINPVQSGSGDPSPENVRPISGWTECNVVVSPTTDAEDGTTYTIHFQSEAGTVYGGTLDVTNGTLTVDWLKYDISQFNITKSVSGLFQTNALTAVIKKPISTLSASGYIKSSLFSEMGSTYITGPNGTSPSPDGVMALSSLGMLYFNYLATSDIDVFKRAMKNVDFVYELATPQTYQLTPTVVQMLLGTNNIWADTGEVKELKYIPQTYNDILKEVSGGIGTTYTVISNTTQTTNEWVNPIKISCNPLDYDVIIFDITGSVDGRFYCITFPHTLPLDSGTGDNYKSYALQGNFIAYPARFADGMGMFTETGVTLNVNKVTGIKFGGIL